MHKHTHMRGRTCVITGANAGLGYESTRALAHQGGEIVMICRSGERGEKARASIISETGNPDIHLLIADLSSQEDVRQAARIINNRWGKVDVLMNNAAMVLSKRILNDDGIEMQFAVNHISHFLLTHCLLPSLVSSPHARVINVSSRNHWFGKIHFGNLTLKGTYQLLIAYAQSKLANVLFTNELDRQLHAHGIDHVVTHCIDPGRNLTDIGLKHTNRLHTWVWKLRRKKAQHPAEGARTQIYVATSPDISHLSGQYWVNMNPDVSAPQSHDPDAARKLWQISEVMCGIEDYFRPPSGTIIEPTVKPEAPAEMA